MDFALSEEQQQIRDSILKLCARFDDAYWLGKDKSGDFPHELHAALAEAGWLGIAMPAEYGGAGLGITEAAIMMQAIAESGAAMSGASAVHINIFGLHPVVVFGTDEQKRRMLPPLIAGEHKACFAVTEPNAGLDTTQLKVRAERRGDHYLLSGQKILDIDRAGRQQGADPRPHHAPRGGQTPDRGPEPVLHRPRPQPGGDPGHREDGPPCGRFRTRCSSTG